MSKDCQQNKASKFKKIYVDAKSRKWHFHGTTKNGEELTELLKANWLMKCSYYKTKSSARYRCSKSPKARNGCKFKGMYSKKTGTFYIRNKHNHPIFEITEAPMGNDDFVDQHKNHWRFLATANNKEDLAALLKENWLNRSEVNKTTINYRCCRFGRDGCKFKALLLKKSCKFYGKNAHNHPVFAIGGRGDYVDRNKQHWRFLAIADSNENLGVLLKENWLVKNFSHGKRRYGTCSEEKDFYVCRRYTVKQLFGGLRCDFRAIHLKANSGVYTMGEHNHALREGETPKGTDDYFDLYGKCWTFFAPINDRAHLCKIAEQNCLQIIHNNQTNMKATCRMNRTRRQKRDCPARATFLKSNSTLYLRGEHNHKLGPIKIGRPKTSAQREKKNNKTSTDSDSEEEDEISSGEKEDFEEKEDEDSDSDKSTDSEMETDEESQEDNEHSDGDEHEGNEAEESQNLDGNLRQDEQQIEENRDAIEQPELEIVEEVNWQEYKRLPPMKRECDANNAGQKQWPTVTIESEVAGWQWQQTRSQKEALLRPVKKEEHADEQPEEPLKNQPSTSNANANPNVGPHRMYLRARKPVNYAENHLGK